MHQRVLYDLWRTRLSRCRMIWLPPPTPSPPLPSLSQSSFLSPVQFTDGGRGGGGVSRIIRRRERLVLYKSFNTLSGVHPLSEQMEGKKHSFLHLADPEVEFTEIFFADNRACFANCSLNSGRVRLARFLHLADPEVEFTDVVWHFANC